MEHRPYQQRITNKSASLFLGTHVDASGNYRQANSVMIESPTGSGKTAMGLSVCKKMQQSVDQLHIAWVAMRRTLLSQAVKENIKHGLNVQNIHYVSMFDKDPTELLQAKADGHTIMLVADEAHHVATDNMIRLYTLLDPTYILGLTATPFRSDKLRLVFDQVIKDCGIHQLIQDGYLSRYHHYTIPEWTPESVAAAYLREPSRWGKSIFYFVNLEQCFELNRLLQDAGVRSDVVTGTSDREEQLEAFENGGVVALINCMVLTEGFDCPSLQTVWVRDSSKGPTMQMAGRAFRKHPEIMFKQIVQSKATDWPFMKSAHPDESYVWQSDEWRSLTLNPHIERIGWNGRIAAMEASVNSDGLPLFILQKQVKRRRRLNV